MMFCIYLRISKMKECLLFLSVAILAVAVLVFIILPERCQYQECGIKTGDLDRCYICSIALCGKKHVCLTSGGYKVCPDCMKNRVAPDFKEK